MANRILHTAKDKTVAATITPGQAIAVLAQHFKTFAFVGVTQDAKPMKYVNTPCESFRKQLSEHLEPAFEAVTHWESLEGETLEHMNAQISALETKLAAILVKASPAQHAVLLDGATTAERAVLEKAVAKGGAK